ncbi:SusC/RagA family TonB-linked outer membrane protein [Belliella pelovolcani]|uniref:TonB-linked outer membrane protein, SusC/RagA family n=2 Tax=Belliella pelovolcani TaxID=529505 RepID=A0A1N7MZS9_9BACT|nr:SusC/RagA family TonB-linked outer membrane protein [Belliella pelovolcani]SIS91595.1 TonB-linked outer membrane protein, SusC/RagA family [Belliella pelovolcani]
MKRVLLSLLLLVFATNEMWAQSKAVTGRVTSTEEPEGIPGVNILIKGSSSGTTTDLDGRYTIEVPSDQAVLVFSFIGYKTREERVGSRSEINVNLASDLEDLSEFIVTAQGIERDERSLGYAVQSIKGDLVSQKSEPNLLNSLQGKLTGVNIVGASGAPGASTNINIRGITSFTGSNQPLIVVDGIIFNNDTDNTQNTLFGSQPANRLNDIAPESIESINVLKGPAASVLYGSRASAGAIVITTKSGANMNDKTEITVNSSVNFQNVYGLPSFQNQFGQGTQNDFNNISTASWGPAFGTPGFETVETSFGTTVPYQAFPNNVRDFYQRGRIVQNGVSIASGNRDDNFIVSVNSSLQDGIIPESFFNRNNVQVGGNKKLNNGVKVSGNVTYVKSESRNTITGNGGSAFGQITRIPRSFDLVGEPFQDELGNSLFYNPAQNHPLWSTQNEFLESTVDRVFGNFKVGYDISDWLNITYRVTADTYTDRRKAVSRIGSARTPAGSIADDMIYRSELNGDLLITASKSNIFTEGLSASLLLGQNINQRNLQTIGVLGSALNVPFFDNVSNASVFTGSGEFSNVRRLLGYYAQLSLDYNNYLFLELSGRVDQSSTLPAGNNAYFYPSIATSFVLTDAFNIESDVLSYAKLRASAATVGRDADPYRLNTFFGIAGFGNNVASVQFPIGVGGANIPGFSPGAILGSDQLTPEFVTSYEVGGNIGLFNNRLSIDAAYFFTRSTNQIFDVAVSNASGFDVQTANVGEMVNQGIELELNATILEAGNFSWDMGLNFTRIRNEVREIAPGVDQSGIPGNGFIGLTPSIVVGQPYGVIVGNAMQRNAAGELLINPLTGGYLPGIAGQVIANPQPDWLAGLMNTFRYKNWMMSVLVDTRQGGDIYSFGMVDQRNGGTLAMTGVDRDLPRVLPGVIEVGDGQYVPNNIQVPAQTYWAGLGGLISESGVYDATVYRLREVSLAYNLPRRFLERTPFGEASIGFSGRNLWFFAPGFPGDPELNTQGAGNIQGLDLNGVPNTRNYGVNIRFTL